MHRNTCLASPQMAIWAISASPMIMGNDMRKVAPDSKAILLNKVLYEGRAAITPHAFSFV